MNNLELSSSGYKVSILDSCFFIFLTSVQFFRVDLFFGNAGFILSPALISAFALIYFFALRGRFTLTKYIKVYFMLVVLLLLYSTLRVLPLEDFLQIKRLVLFSITTISSVICLVMLDKSNRLENLLSIAIKLSTTFYVFLSVVQVYFFVTGKHYGYSAEPLSFIELYPRTIGPFLPRLTGGFIDPNVCGYYFTFFFFLSFINEKIRSYRIFFALIVVFTLSRSAIAALFAAYLFLIALNIIDNFHLLTRVRKRTLKLLAVLGVFMTILAVSVSQKLVLLIGTALNARLGDKGSTNIHVNLYDLAFNELSNDMMALIFGKGFSTSFIYTRDIFGDNKYGNFHSEYVTILFETGIIGSVIYALFFLVPLFQLIRNRKEIKYANVLIAILFSIFLQNIFYQQYMFFYYWIIIAFLWYQTFSSRLKLSS